MAKGNVLGGSLLITGSCVGAGMLALPILTGRLGFFPALSLFFLAAFFMTLTALFLVEVGAGWKKSVDLISMTSRTMGSWGQISCWILYLFLFYSLITAYISGSGKHLSTVCSQVLPVGTLGHALSPSVGSLFFVCLFGGMVYLGTHFVDGCNRLLMFFKILAYVGVIVTGCFFVQRENLLHVDMSQVFSSFPILIISFGFHNMIPSLTRYMEGDLKLVRRSIVGGALFTFVLYMVWEFVALGALPVGGAFGIEKSLRGDVDAVEALHRTLQIPSITFFGSALALFAILTSFLAQTLSLVHFLRDGMGAEKGRRSPIFLCLLALVPPTLFAFFYPDVFFSALNFAGGVCAVLLFGLFPPLMAWIRRYRDRVTPSYLVFGGKPLMIVTFAVACAVLTYQILQMWNGGIG